MIRTMLRKTIPLHTRFQVRDFIKQFKNYRSLGYRHIPRLAVVETTVSCNAGCVYCPRFVTDSLPNPPHMPFDLFMHIIDILPFIDRVAPYSRGEPLLYPNIVEAVQYLTDNHKESLIYSNGSLANENMVGRLMQAGLTELSFSIDTDTDTEFEQVRGLKWGNVLKNIKSSVHIRDNEDYQTQIRVRCCVGPWNRHKIETIREFWLDIVDEIRFMPYIDFPELERLQKRPFINMHPVPCNQLSNSLNIRADGIVDFCCNDWHVIHSLGKVTLESSSKDLLKMYNSRLANSIRTAQRTGRNLPSICAYCQQLVRNERLKRELM